MESKGGAAARPGLPRPLPSSPPPAPHQLRPPPPAGCEQTALTCGRGAAVSGVGKVRLQGAAAPPAGPASGPGEPGLPSCAPPPPARAPARDPGVAGLPRCDRPALDRGYGVGVGVRVHRRPMLCTPRRAGAAAEGLFVCAAGAGMPERQWSPRPARSRAGAEPGVGVQQKAKPLRHAAI